MDDDGGAGKCRLCEILPALGGVLAAVAILFVSLDLLAGGGLTKAALRLAGPPDQGGADGDTAD
jgi:hypothetical protein